MGMAAEVTVGSAQSPRAAAPNGTMTLTDSARSTCRRTSRPGGTFAVDQHRDQATRLRPRPAEEGAADHVFQCVGGSFGKGTPIDNPGELAGGITSLPAGNTRYLKIAPLPAGTYGYLSTQGDGADLQAGLNGTFTA